MKQKLLDDLLKHLSADPVERGWNDERARLLKEVQAERDAIVPYQSRVNYRLEWHHTVSHSGYVDGVWKTTTEPCNTNLPECPRTSNAKKMKANIQKARSEYALDELRLYHGSKRIQDIESWLSEN